MPEAYENIIYEKKPPIAYITLNRPEKMNAFSHKLQLEVMEALEDAGWEDDKIRVIVIKGAGRCFSTGFDLNDEVERNVVQQRAHFFKEKVFHLRGWWDFFWKNPKPIIAQIHSFCLAGGMATVSFCDHRICSEDALFGYPNIRTGAPLLPAIWPWILGIGKAKELLFTGNLIDAQEAWRLGLVNKVVPSDKLEEEVNKMARTISKVPAVTNEYSKVAVNAAYEMMGIRQVMERNDELEVICYAGAKDEMLPEAAEFKKIRTEQGLKAALAWRSDRFAEEDAWWKERRAK